MSRSFWFFDFPRTKEEESDQRSQENDMLELDLMELMELRSRPLGLYLTVNSDMDVMEDLQAEGVQKMSRCLVGPSRFLSPLKLWKR